METAYSLKEKILVASFIRDMGKAIENKKTDAVSVERKNSAWERITTQYNSQPESTTVRTAQQLKKLSANIQYTKYVVDVGIFGASSSPTSSTKS
jgi:hypothetical protein